MPRLTPITGKSEVPAEHHGVVDAVGAGLANAFDIAPPPDGDTLPA